MDDFTAGLFSNTLQQAGGTPDLFDVMAGALSKIIGDPMGIGTGSQVMPSAGAITVNAYACPRGKHISKAKKGPSVGKCVTNRHMNSLNPHALARAVRRLAGFQNFATKTEKAIQASFRKAGVHPARRIGGKCGSCKKSPCGCR